MMVSADPRPAGAFGRTASASLPHGVRVRALHAHRDDRGSLTELFRQPWTGGEPTVQWNAVRSEAAVMRGVHIHLGYHEYYVVLEGRVSVGCRDVRRGSPTEGATALVELSSARPRAMQAPPGIAHGLLFHERSLLLVGTTACWDPRHELGCHWLDPALEIPWPTRSSKLSARDAALPPLAEVLERVPAWRDA